MKAIIVCPHCGHRIVPHVTAREQRVLDAVGRSWQKRGFPPTVVELSRELCSPETTIKRDIDALVAKNHLFRAFRGPRNLYPAQPPKRAIQ